MAKWHIGCSGFDYKHWKGLFYPEDLPKSKWFNFYTEHYDTLELNLTFYRFPKIEVFQSLYKRSPKNFKITVKAPRIITHFKQFHGEAREWMLWYYKTIREGLQDKLGCILFQLPSRTSYNEERLQRIINTMDSSFSNVIEFRHESWWNDEVYKKLGKHNVTFCGISHPELPDDVIQNTKLVYYMFHGASELYKSRYSEAQLRSVAKKILGNPKIKQAYIYFNNDIGGSAIFNAEE